MSVIIKCKSCNGTGYVPMGNGVRGLLVCKACNGVGTYENDEITIINDEPFYKIPNGTNYNYTSIPKEFKPYFDKLQQENQKCKEVIDKANKFIEENCYEHYDSYNDEQYDILESKKELLDILKEVE